MDYGSSGHVGRALADAADGADTSVQGCGEGFSKNSASGRTAQQEPRGSRMDDRPDACPNAPGVRMVSFDRSLLLFSHETSPDQRRRAFPRPRLILIAVFLSRPLFNLADFLFAAAPFAQKHCSIPLDTCFREAHDDFVVSPFEARPPLRSPRAVSLTVRLRIERQEGSTSSARFSPLTRGLTFCPTHRTARPGRSGSRPHHSSSTRIRRGPFLHF